MICPLAARHDWIATRRKNARMARPGHDTTSTIFAGQSIRSRRTSLA